MFIDRPCGRWVPPISGTPATRGVALATASCNAPKDRVSVRLHSHRPRPPNGCARWLPEVAIAPPFAGRGLSRRVAEHRRATLPMGRVSSASAQPALTCPGSRCLGQPARSVQARYGFRCTESSCPPAAGRRTAPRSLSPKGKRRGRDACCVPAQMLSRLGRSGSPAPCAQAPRTPASPSLSRAA